MSRYTEKQKAEILAQARALLAQYQTEQCRTISRYTEKQRAEILAQARAHLAQHQTEQCRQQQVQPPKNNAAECWKRQQLEAAAPRYREASDPDWAVLGNGQAREFYIQVMAEVSCELQLEFEHKLKGQAEQIRAVEIQLAELRGASSVRAAEYKSAIAELRQIMNADQAKVIDLPDILDRAHN